MKDFKNILGNETSLIEGVEIGEIKGTGKKGVEVLDVKQFSAGKDNGTMVQVTQGMKYIQLNRKHAAELAKILAKWSKTK